MNDDSRMTNPSRYTSIQKISQHFSTETHKHSSSTQFLIFADVLLRQVVRMNETYERPPVTDENFDEEADFTNKFIQYRYKFTKLEAFAKYKRYIAENAFDINDEQFSDLESQEEGMEEKAVRLDMEERAENGYKQFETMLSSYELYIFIGMKKGKSVARILEVLQINGYKTTVDKINHIKKQIEFRLLCFFAQERQRLYDRDVVLKAMNKHPAFCKKSFGSKTLLVLPSDDELIYVAAAKYKKDAYENRPEMDPDPVDLLLAVQAYDPKAVRAEKESKHRFSSKISFDGKLHDHPVVYINDHGYAYDHTNKEVKKLA